MKNNKPLGRKSYGSIGHLPNRRMGPSESQITEGQAEIATLKKRDKHDIIIVQEKLDGSNVGIALKDGEILALTRAGYLASTSRFDMHHKFDSWVIKNEFKFRNVLREGERLCGEWLTTAHGTIYNLPHEPFVAFDIIGDGNKRLIYNDFKCRVLGHFVIPAWADNNGMPMSVSDALEYFGEFGVHGAQEQIEGVVWRVERRGIVGFLCKYVRPDKIDGKYLGDNEIMNTWAGEI